MDQNAPGETGGSAGVQNEDDSQAAQRRLALIADALPVLISYVDAERRYQYNNAAYTRWFGTSREAMRGRSLPDVLGTAAYQEVRGYVDAVLGGEAVSFESTLPYKDAGVRRVVAHYVPDIAPDGRVAGFFALVEDVSAQRKAEEELRQREDEVRQLQKMEALGRLAGGIAHDFNNLLQSIISSCSVILMSMPDAEAPLSRHVARMKRTAERGASLTRQLLTFSRREEAEASPLDLDALLADMEMLLERLLESNIALESDRRAGCTVLADPGDIQQLMMNLVINARDAMPDGGTLRIESHQAAVGPEETARHPTVQPGPYVRVTVADTGTGMDEATRARIFEPFFTTKPPERGTGLGLSTVYGLVQRLHGFIEVDTAPGAGTTFRVFLPCVPPAPTEP